MPGDRGTLITPSIREYAIKAHWPVPVAMCHRSLNLSHVSKTARHGAPGYSFKRSRPAGLLVTWRFLGSDHPALRRLRTALTIYTTPATDINGPNVERAIIPDALGQPPRRKSHAIVWPSPIPVNNPDPISRLSFMIGSADFALCLYSFVRNSVTCVMGIYQQLGPTMTNLLHRISAGVPASSLVIVICAGRCAGRLLAT